MRQKLSIITLGVANFQRAVNFYETGLGWKKSDKSIADLALFPLGGMILGLYPLPDLTADTTLNYQPSDFYGITLAYNAVSEKEVNEVLDTVQKLGATIVKPAQKVFWGGYSGYFKDLDDYVFEVAYNPFWPLDENGNLDL